MQALPHDGVNRFQGWESRLKIPIPVPWPSKNPICPLGGFFFLFFPRLSESSGILDKPGSVTMEM